MKQLLGMVMFFLLGLTLAQEPNFIISSTTQASYTQNDAGSIDIFVKLQEASPNLENAVIFLNVVEATPNYPQAAHKIFTSASEEPKVFQIVHSAETLLAGIGTTLNFQLKARAKPATYSLVIQVFEGSNTDPHKVGAQTRLALQGFNFDIVEP